MKKRSVTGFVLGLIGSIFGVAWGFFSAILGDVIAAIASTAIVSVLGWICFFGGIAGIIGASLCFNKAKSGAITLVFSTIACTVLWGYLFSQMIISGEVTSTTVIIILVPFALMVAGTISAFFAKEVKVNNQPYGPYYYGPQGGYPNQPYGPQQFGNYQQPYNPQGGYPNQQPYGPQPQAPVPPKMDNNENK